MKSGDPEARAEESETYHRGEGRQAQQILVPHECPEASMYGRRRVGKTPLLTRLRAANADLPLTASCERWEGQDRAKNPLEVDAVARLLDVRGARENGEPVDARPGT